MRARDACGKFARLPPAARTRSGDPRLPRLTAEAPSTDTRRILALLSPASDLNLTHLFIECTFANILCTRCPVASADIAGLGRRERGAGDMIENKGTETLAKGRKGRPRAGRPAGTAGAGRRVPEVTGTPRKSRGKATAKRRVGRPREKVPEKLAEEICKWVAQGSTLRSFCRQPGRPAWRTVHDWVGRKDPESGHAYGCPRSRDPRGLRSVRRQTSRSLA